MKPERLDAQADVWEWGLKDLDRVLAGFALCLSLMTDPEGDPLTTRQIKRMILGVAKKVKATKGGIPT